MKKNFSLLVFGSVLALGACTPVSPNPATSSSTPTSTSVSTGGSTSVQTLEGFGPAADGTVCVGNWALSNDTLTSNNAGGEGKIFVDGAKTNLSLSFDVKIVEGDATIRHGFGAYVFYKDSENNVKFTVENGSVLLESTKGYDTQSVQAFYPAALTFATSTSIEATKNGDLFEVYFNNKLITSLQESFEGEGQTGLLTNRAKVEFKDVTVSDYVFASKDIENDIYTPAAGMPGTWEIEGNSVKRVDTDPTTANFESVVFNSAVANNYAVEATVSNAVAIEGGYNLYGFLAYYRNATNYVIVFLSGQYVDMMMYVNGVQKWPTGGVLIPNLPDPQITQPEIEAKIYCEKVGPRMNIFCNDVFIRSVESEYYDAPGSVGMDTNGACADYVVNSLKTINAFSSKVVDEGLMTAVNYPHLLAQNGNTYTTIEATAPNGANYNGTVYTHGSVFGTKYTYEVTLDTTYLNAVAANAIGVYGGISDSSSIALLVCGNGYVDLFGSFTYENDQGENVEVTNTFAGMGKEIPSECKTEGVLNQFLQAKVVLEAGTFTFYLNGVELYSIAPKTFNICWPGIIANYVGASFTF